MSLASSFIGVFIDEAYNLNLSALVAHVNKHVVVEEYAVILTRIKASKKNVKFKTWLRCNREGKIKLLSEKSGQRAHESTRLQACPFVVIVKLNIIDERWYVDSIKNSEHNHDSSLAVAHSALRKLVMISAVQQEIARQFRIDIFSSQIFTSLRLDIDEETSLFKRTNIYNVRARIWR